MGEDHYIQAQAYMYILYKGVYIRIYMYTIAQTIRPTVHAEQEQMGGGRRPGETTEFKETGSYGFGYPQFTPCNFIEQLQLVEQVAIKRNCIE